MRPCAVSSGGAVVMLSAQSSDLPTGMEAIPNRSQIEGTPNLFYFPVYSFSRSPLPARTLLEVQGEDAPAQA